jgi:hypothetical protein
MYELLALIFATAMAAPIPTPRIGQFVCTRVNAAGNCAPGHWDAVPSPNASPTPSGGPYCGKGLVYQNGGICIQ